MTQYQNTFTNQRPFHNNNNHHYYYNSNNQQQQQQQQQQLSYPYANANAMSLDYSGESPRGPRVQQRPPPRHLQSTYSVVSLKGLNYTISSQDLVDAVNHLNGARPPMALDEPILEYDNSGRPTGTAMWYIQEPNDALRVAHLLNNEVLDNQQISAAVVSTGTPAAAGRGSGPAGGHAAVAAGPLHGVRKGGINAGERKKPLMQRLGPKPVLARLGPKKGEVLTRLGPKLSEPSILGRLGAKKEDVGAGLRAKRGARV